VTALLITGTGTGVGKTTVTAAIALLAATGGARVTVLKPAQTGEPDDADGDVQTIARRVPTAHTLELVRYPQPLSPEAAARASGRPALSFETCLSAVLAAQADCDLLLVEGAGGLLVSYDQTGWTMRDIANAANLPAVLVTAAGLGTLNATALTLEALDRDDVRLHAVVIGSWPSQPGPAERSNIGDLEHAAGGPLAGALPAGTAELDMEAFTATARAGLGPALGGDFDPDAFRRRFSP
jgi:dethiobiotin synthetase